MLRHLRPGGALADAATLHRAAAATAGAPHAARHRGHSMRPHATAGDAAGSSGAVSLRHTAVIGGGMAGLAAAAELTAAGVRVTLVEQGRGLGGRVCSRRASISGADVYFDHGAQYLTAKQPAFAALLQQLEAGGAVARWGADGSIGDVPLNPDGTFNAAGFKPYDPAAKALWVGTPSMSAVGRQLAAAAGPGLQVLRGTRAAALARAPGGGWRLQLEGRAAPAGVGDGDAVAARQQAEAAEFDVVVTAMSANSTRRLLTGVFDAAAADAAAIKANGLPFNGALVINNSSSSAGGGGGDSAAAEHPIAWLARDSSKPGRAAQLPPGCAETWVVHAAPGWSNARASSDKKAVAAELLGEFLRAAGATGSKDAASDVLYLEAHAWTNAYPLNPRAPQPVAGMSGAAGAFVLDAEKRLVSCGDWCLGPRAADAWASGRDAAQAALQLLA